MTHEANQQSPRTKTAAPVGAGCGCETGNLRGDFGSYYGIGRPLTLSDGFRRYAPWHDADAVLLTLGLYSSGYVLTTGGKSCHFDTFLEAYDAAWVLNYFAKRTVFIAAALEHELARVR